MKALYLLFPLVTAINSGFEYVTCGSVIKLSNKGADMRLHRYIFILS